MSVHFEIQLTACEGALLRTLGLIQRRGFRVEELALKPDGDWQTLKLAVDGNGRCPAVLARQIARLHDVRQVQRREGEAWHSTVTDCVRALANLMPGRDPLGRPALEMGR